MSKKPRHTTGTPDVDLWQMKYLPDFAQSFKSCFLRCASTILLEENRHWSQRLVHTKKLSPSKAFEFCAITRTAGLAFA